MERWLKVSFSLVAVSGLFWVNKNYGDFARRALKSRFQRSPRMSPSPLAKSIEEESAQRRLNHVLSEYRRVQLLVEAAGAQGRDVRRLQENLAHALQLANSGHFPEAMTFINIAEVRIPRPSEPLRPAVAEDAANPFPDLETPAKKKKRARQRRTKAGTPASQ